MAASRDAIGPALPPGFSRASSPDDEAVAGPALPPDYKSNLKRRGGDEDRASPRVPTETDSDSEDERGASQMPRNQRRLQDDDDGFFGPALPPGFKKQDDSPERALLWTLSLLRTKQLPVAGFWEHLRGDSDNIVDFLSMGRWLKTGSFKKTVKTSVTVPPIAVEASTANRPVIGPALPPGFKKPSEEGEENRCSPGSFVPSPFTSQDSNSSEDEEAIIGPLPAKGPTESSVAADFECRARRMKEKLLGHDDNESKQVKRESWMTELPPELKGFGLGSRTFKRRADDKSGDRSIWTDTPADRERKAKEMQDGKKSASKGDGAIVVSERDKKLVEQVSSHNDSQRSESLMEIHHRKMKRKAAEEKNKPQERRPFDRDEDLQVHRFDEAQKRALIKQSRDLNTRFSHSKCNMFL